MMGDITGAVCAAVLARTLCFTGRIFWIFRICSAHNGPQTLHTRHESGKDHGYPHQFSLIMPTPRKSKWSSKSKSQSRWQASVTPEVHTYIRTHTTHGLKLEHRHRSESTVFRLPHCLWSPKHINAPAAGWHQLKSSEAEYAQQAHQHHRITSFHKNSTEARPYRRLQLEVAQDGDRLLLNGEKGEKGEKILTLASTYASPKQWGEWLRLPLIGAAVEGDAALVKELLAAGADARCTGHMDPDGSTFLHAAAEGGSEKAMNALLNAGACSDVNQSRPVGDREFPLHVAAKAGHLGMCSALIGAGAEVNCRDRNRWTPLHLAARFGQVEVVADLLRDGADREAEDVNGYRPLHYATMWGHPSTTKALLKAGAALEPITRVDGMRPLHIAARYGSALVVQELLTQGAEKDAKTARGFTPMHAAAAPNKAGAIVLLVQAGADINLPDGHLGFTPLHLAARRGAVQAASILLEAGARVGLKTTQDGSTPLHLACTHLKLSAVNLLLRYGADESALNDAQETPADVIAFFRAHEDRDQFLVDKIKLALMKAPADRAWRRRGWILMTRARIRCAKLLVPPSQNGGGEDSDGRGEEEEGEGDVERVTAKIFRRQVDDDLWKAKGDVEEGDGGLGIKAEGGILGQIAGLKEEGIFHNIVLFL